MRGGQPATHPVPKSTKVVWLRRKDLSLGPSVSPGLYLRHQQCANSHWHQLPPRQPLPRRAAVAASGARAEQRWRTGDTGTEREEGRCHGGSAEEEGTRYHLRKQPSIGNLQAEVSCIHYTVSGCFSSWAIAHGGWLGDAFSAGFYYAPGNWPLAGGRAAPLKPQPNCGKGLSHPLAFC